MTWIVTRNIFNGFGVCTYSSNIFDKVCIYLKMESIDCHLLQNITQVSSLKNANNKRQSAPRKWSKLRAESSLRIHVIWCVPAQKWGNHFPICVLVLGKNVAPQMRLISVPALTCVWSGHYLPATNLSSVPTSKQKDGHNRVSSGEKRANSHMVCVLSIAIILHRTLGVCRGRCQYHGVGPLFSTPAQTCMSPKHERPFCRVQFSWLIAASFSILPRLVLIGTFLIYD
jgi:hypothetical protein